MDGTSGEEITEPEPLDVDGPILTINEALERIPATLVKEMEELLRADFREVRRWSPPKTQP
jgi:hypothetical protein